MPVMTLRSLCKRINRNYSLLLISKSCHFSADSWQSSTARKPRKFTNTPEKVSKFSKYLPDYKIELNDDENGSRPREQNFRRNVFKSDGWDDADRHLSSVRVGAHSLFSQTLPKVKRQSPENFSVPKLDETYTSCEDFLTRVLLSAPRELTSDEWELVKGEIVDTIVPYEAHAHHNNKKRLTLDLFSTFTVSLCSKVKAFDSALSFVESQKEPLTQTAIISLFNLFSRCPSTTLQLGTTRGDRFDKIVTEILKSFEEYTNEAKESILAGISCTPRWKSYLKCLASTSTTTGQAYALKCFALTALDNEDFVTFWDIINQPAFTHYLFGCRQSSSNAKKSLAEDVFLKFFQKLITKFGYYTEQYCYDEIKKNRSEESWKLCEKMFVYFKEHGYHMRPEVQQSVVPFLKAFRRNRSGVPLFSSINHMGTCNSCGSEIEKPLINNEDLTDLKEALLSKVILKDDIYKATCLDDLENFRNHLASNSSYDVVIDGLNVSLSRFPGVNNKSLKFQSETLYQTLLTTKSLNLKVLVIHRPILKQYKDLAAISNLCNYIILDKLTEDDPFTILAALVCGIGTKIITNDTLRQHFQKMDDLRLKKIFLRWQLSHQINHYMEVKQKSYHNVTVFPILMHPRSYTSEACRSEKFWHLPMDLRTTLTKDDKTMKNITFPKRWLCVPIPKFDIEKNISEDY